MLLGVLGMSVRTTSDWYRSLALNSLFIKVRLTPQHLYPSMTVCENADIRYTSFVHTRTLTDHLRQVLLYPPREAVRRARRSAHGSLTAAPAGRRY